MSVDAVDGKFSTNKFTPRHLRYAHPMSALSFVKLPHVLSGDPVIVLHDGDRVRICQGGDPRHIRVDAECMLMSHDKRVREERRKIQRTDTDPEMRLPDLSYLTAGSD